jgi:hypothetical protein
MEERRERGRAEDQWKSCAAATYDARDVHVAFSPEDTRYELTVSKGRDVRAARQFLAGTTLEVVEQLRSQHPACPFPGIIDSDPSVDCV